MKIEINLKSWQCYLEDNGRGMAALGSTIPTIGNSTGQKMAQQVFYDYIEKRANIEKSYQKWQGGYRAYQIEVKILTKEDYNVVPCLPVLGRGVARGVGIEEGQVRRFHVDCVDSDEEKVLITINPLVR